MKELRESNNGVKEALEKIMNRKNISLNLTTKSIWVKFDGRLLVNKDSFSMDNNRNTCVVEFSDINSFEEDFGTLTLFMKNKDVIEFYVG